MNNPTASGPIHSLPNNLNVPSESLGFWVNTKSQLLMEGSSMSAVAETLLEGKQKEEP